MHGESWTFSLLCEITEACCFLPTSGYRRDSTVGTANSGVGEISWGSCFPGVDSHVIHMIMGHFSSFDITAPLVIYVFIISAYSQLDNYLLSSIPPVHTPSVKTRTASLHVSPPCLFSYFLFSVCLCAVWRQRQVSMETILHSKTTSNSSSSSTNHEWYHTAEFAWSLYKELLSL